MVAKAYTPHHLHRHAHQPRGEQHRQQRSGACDRDRAWLRRTGGGLPRIGGAGPALPHAGPLEEQRADGHGEVQDGRHAQRAAEAERLDQDERGGERAAGGPQNVGDVQVTEAPPATGPRGIPQRRQRQREGRPHADAERQERRRDPAAGGQVIAQRSPGGPLPRPQQEVAPDHQEPGDDERRHADDRFGAGVEAKRSQAGPGGGAPRQAPPLPGADRQPGHEHRKDGRDERGDDPELRHRQAQPDHLGDQAAESGRQEEDEKPGAPPVPHPPPLEPGLRYRLTGAPAGGN